MASVTETALALRSLPRHRHPLHNPQVMAKVAFADPELHRQLLHIQANPTLSSMATSGGEAGATATDPTGTNIAGQSGNLGWGNQLGGRNPRVRHVLLGFTTQAINASATVSCKATPNVDFKPNRLVTIPTVLFGGAIAGVQSGIRPQYVALTSEDTDIYQPASYGGELDLDAVRATVPIVANVTNNGTQTATFNACFVGVAVGMQYRELTSKLMDGSLGTSGSVSAAGTGTLTLSPLIGYTCRKILFTPGAGFSDYFVITAITAGIQNQLMSGDPIPASVFTDLFPLFVDFDRVTAAVPLTISYQNVAASSGVLKGTTRGDVDINDLARYQNLGSIGGSPAGS